MRTNDMRVDIVTYIVIKYRNSWYIVVIIYFSSFVLFSAFKTLLSP